MTFGMCYRYIYLLLRLLKIPILPLKAAAARKIHYQRGQRIVAWNIAGPLAAFLPLERKCVSGDAVPGYSGEPAVLNDFKVKPKDWLWLSVVLALALKGNFSGVLLWIVMYF